MGDRIDPCADVARQLAAYNARDLDAFIACWTPDARIYQFPDTLLAGGREAIRERHLARFAQAHVHGELLHRSAVGHVVVDHERVTRTRGDLPLIVEVVAIYEVGEDGLIASARMIEAG